MEERKTYYWVTAIDNETGKRVLYGPEDTPEEAEQLGFEKAGISFEIIPLTTRNTNEAGARVRAIMLNRGNPLSTVMRRMKRKANGNERIG